MKTNTSIVSAVVALLGSHPSAIALGQDTSAAVLALVAASTLSTIPAATPEQKFATVIILVVGSTVMTSLLFLLLGRYRLGDLIRFLPYPVVGGFLLSLAQLHEMEKEDPETASTFHHLIVHLLAERVVHLIKAVDALLR